MKSRNEVKQDSQLLNQPKEILRTIFSFFNQADLSRAGVACKQLNEIGKEERFKALPMPKFDYAAIKSSSKVPYHLRHMSADKDIYYLLPFAEGNICFRSKSVAYIYFDEQSQQYKETNLPGLKYTDDAVSACALSNDTFVVGDSTQRILCYRRQNDQSFVVKCHHTMNYNASIVGLIKKNETDFLAAYSNGNIAFFQFKNKALSCSFVFPITGHGWITSVAGTFDNLLLGFSNGVILNCSVDDVSSKLNVLKEINRHADEISRILVTEENVMTVFTDTGLTSVINYKDDRLISRVKALYPGVYRNIKFIVPLDNGQWLVRGEHGNFNLQQFQFEKEPKPENDNAVSTPKLK